MITDIREAMEGMIKTYDREAVKTWEGTVQVDINGEQNGTWWITVKNGEVELREGKIENPDVTIRMSDQDFLSLANGRMKGSDIFLDERMEVEGDFEILFKFEKTFPPISSEEPTNQ